MSLLGQKTLISRLIDIESVERLAREGLDPQVIPDERLRPLVDFAIGYYHQSGRTAVPTEEVMRLYFGDTLDDAEIDLGGYDETIDWAIDDLKAAWVHREASSFNKRFATDMAQVSITERIEVLNSAASELVQMSMRMESKEAAVDAREGMIDRLVAYAERADDVATGRVRGMRLGLPEIDSFIHGIHDGEMAVLAAPPKTGKSYMLDRCALMAWTAGGKPALFSLENSVEMTLDRIACLATGIDSKRFQDGQCTPEEIARVTAWVESSQSAENPLWVLSPEDGQRTPEALVRQAQMRGADSLLIDQLSWVEHPSPRGLSNTEQTSEKMRSLRTLISSGRHKLPCLLAHQINREGAKAAGALGYLNMWHLADSSEVERASDFVFGLYQSNDERAARAAKFQMLASRRTDLKHWLLTWNVNLGAVSVRTEIDLDM